MDALIDELQREPACAGVSRSHVAFIALMAAYRSGDASITPAIKPAVLEFMKAGTGPTPKAVHMQAAFYCSYTAARRALDKRTADRQRRLQHADDALNSVAAGSNDISKLGTAYKHVLDFCTASCSADSALCGMKPSRAMDLLEYLSGVQREFAAALESVLPRTGLKEFLQLPSQDRSQQLDEVARLVVGIRLFNWEGGKGGPGLEHTPSLALADARALFSDIQSALTATLTLCGQYTEVLGAVHAGNMTATPEDVARWSSELLNRRALVLLLAAVAEDAASVKGRVTDAAEGYAGHLADLKRDMGSRVALAKDAVYPRFAGMARCWLEASEGRCECFELQAVVDSIKAHLPGGTVSTLPFAITLEVQRAAERFMPDMAPVTPLAAELERAEYVESTTAASLGLPLELQGTCPVSLCTPVKGAPAGHTLGLFQPGHPDHGLYKYRNRLFAVSSASAGAAFSAAPSLYLTSLRALALLRPELVHLLEMTQKAGPLADHGASFPLASFTLLASFDGDVAATAAAVAEKPAEVLGAASLAQTSRLGSTGRTSKSGRPLVDVGVETPVHFVERHIDQHYQFSEWALRRQALRIANIRKCATHGAQTDASHFKRDNESQVYLPRENGTQTGISVGVNTDRQVVYVAGVRGTPEPFVEAAIANKGAGLPALGDTGSKTKLVPGPTHAMRIVTATLEV